MDYDKKFADNARKQSTRDKIFFLICQLFTQPPPKMNSHTAFTVFRKTFGEFLWHKISHSKISFHE